MFFFDRGAAMRTRAMLVSLSTAQVIGLIAVVVVLVFGVTLAWRFLPSMMTSGGNKPGTKGSVELVFDETESSVGVVLETKEAGHRNFWFRNAGSVDVVLHLQNKFCQCQTVKVCRQLPPAQAGATNGEEAVQWTAAQLERRANDPDFVWEVLEDHKPLTIPAGAQGGVQLSWNNTQTQPQRFWARLNALAEGAEATEIELGIRVAFIPPIHVSLGDNINDSPAEHERDKIELRPGEKDVVRFLIWSSTRDKFTIKAEPPSLDHPCIKWSDPKPLTPEECKALSEPNGKQVRSGYRLEVNVSERTTDGSRQLDLGPFRRSLTLTFDEKERPIDPVQLWVSGRVHGEISILGNTNKALIDFRQVKVDDTAVEECVLVSRTPGLDLKLDPEFMANKPAYFKEVTLKDLPNKPGQEGRRWTLRVTVHSQVVLGSLSSKERREQSVIVLRTNGDPPRTLRIPVTGTVYR
jgi:hypothetical protein